MQVFGLPGHVIRKGGAALRLIGAETPKYRSGDQTRRRGALAQRHGQGAVGGGGSGDRGRAALHALPLAEGARAQEPPPAPAAQACLAAEARQGGGGTAGRQPDVGQAQVAVLLRREGLAVSLSTLQPLVDAFAHRFNHHRPHDALDGKTPAEYLTTLSSASTPSHMS